MTEETADSAPEILLERDGYVLTLTLNRPARFNSFTGSMVDSLATSLREVNEDADVRVVVVTGAGTRAFSSGLDLQQERGAARYVGDLQRMPQLLLYRVDKPVIAAVNGVAVGAGLDVALACDIRIASRDARFGAIFAKRGLLPESGGTWLLPRLVGWEQAARLLFTGDLLAAEAALKIGLIGEVVDADELLPRAQELARGIAANAPLSLLATKRMMRLGQEETYEASLDHLYMYMLSLTRSDDFREGVQAFLERRPASFTGR